MKFTVNRRVCLGAGLSAAASPLFAAAERSAAEIRAPTLVGADRRPGLDLDGTWRYSVDPYRDGIAGFHGERER